MKGKQRKKAFFVVIRFRIYSFKFIFGGWVCLNFHVSSGLLELTILAEVVAPLNHLGPSEVYEVVVR